MEGWGQVKKVSKYVGMSERTVRDWLKQGLKHARLKSGRILIKYSWVDEFLESFEVDDSQADKVNKIVDSVLKDFNLD